MKKIILISGKKRSGKNTLGNMLEDRFNSMGYSAIQESFAFPLKDHVVNCFYDYITLVNSRTDDDELHIKPFDDNKTAATRLFLQNFGTDFVRKQIDPLFWIKCAQKEVQKSMADVIIFTDCRFLNELLSFETEDVIKIRINRGNGFGDSHSSETELDDYERFDYIIENDKSLVKLSNTASEVATRIATGQK